MENSEIIAFWRRSWDMPDIPARSQVRVTVTLDLDGITGKGVYMVMRADTVVNSIVETSAFESTFERVPMFGAEENETLTLSIPYFPARADQLSLFLIMHGSSSGTVYFKDVRTEVLE